jgi:hypothetical protein
MKHFFCIFKHSCNLIKNVCSLNKKVEKGSKVITFKMVEEINQDNPVKVLNKEEIVLFLQVQHAQGNINPYVSGIRSISILC